MIKIRDFLVNKNEASLAREGEGLFFHPGNGELAGSGEPVGSDPSGRFSYTVEYLMRDLFAYTIKQGGLVGREFFAYDIRRPSFSDERLYLASAESLVKKLCHGVSKALPPGPYYIVGANRVAFNFYHWFYQCLPAVALCSEVLKEAGLPFKVLTPPLNRWKSESLCLLGVETSDVVEVSDDAILEAENLVYCSALSGNYSFHPHPLLVKALDPLRARCLEERQVPVTPLIYISRRDATKRSLDNEMALEAALERLGVQPIVLSEMSIADQVASFAQARLIVAPHGAGLVHLLFAQQGAAVVELLPEHYRNPCFYRIAQLRGLKYSQVLTVPVSGESVHDAVLHVDIEAVVRRVVDLLRTLT